MQKFALTIFVLFLLALFDLPACAADQNPFTPSTSPATSLEPWFIDPYSSPNCRAELSEDVFYNSKRSVLLYAASTNRRVPFYGQCSFLQNFKADLYRGKRMVFGMATKEPKDELYTPATRAWVRVHEAKKEILLDGLAATAISHSQSDDKEWKRHRVMIDVPEEALYISFGIGPAFGDVWISDVYFEETDEERFGPDGKPYPEKPRNLDFQGN